MQNEKNNLELEQMPDLEVFRGHSLIERATLVSRIELTGSCTANDTSEETVLVPTFCK